MPRVPAPLLVVGAGLLTFVIVFAVLDLSPSAAAPGPLATATPTPLVAAGSLAAGIESDQVAVSLPSAGFEGLLRELKRGDRLDVLASLTPATGGQPTTAVLVRGALVLQPMPLVVAVPATDALLVAHVVSNGTHLGYLLWPAGAGPEGATPSPLDDRASRQALGLSTTATPVPVPPTTAPTPPPVTISPTALAETASGFLYQVQPGDTWDSIAATFGLPVSQLRQWNEAATDTDPVPGRLLFIPRTL